MNMNVINEKTITIVSAAVLGVFVLGDPPAEASVHCTVTDTGEEVVVQSGVLCPITSLSNSAWAAER